MPQLRAGRTADGSRGGELSGRAAATVFKLLTASGATGLLTLHGRDAGSRSAALVDGRPVFAFSSFREDRLSATLLREDLISLPSLARATEQMLAQRRRLGEVLVRDKHLESVTLEAALRIQVRDILLRMLNEDRGTWSFQEKALPVPEVELRLPINTLIRESFQQVRDAHRILDEVGGLSAVYSPADGLLEETSTAGLLPAEAALLPALMQPTGIEPLCAASELADLRVCRLVWVLLTINALNRID